MWKMVVGLFLPSMVISNRLALTNGPQNDTASTNRTIVKKGRFPDSPIDYPRAISNTNEPTFKKSIVMIIWLTFEK